LWREKEKERVAAGTHSLGGARMQACLTAITENVSQSELVWWRTLEAQKPTFSGAS